MTRRQSHGHELLRSMLDETVEEDEEGEGGEGKISSTRSMNRKTSVEGRRLLGMLT